MQFYIETERLILRELQPGDAEGMFELDSDREVHRYVGRKPVETIEQSRAVIDLIRTQYTTNGIGRWAVIEKSSGNFIGWAGLKLMKEEINGHIDHYDVGYRFIKKYWGRGYGTEAAIASVRYGFDVLKLQVVYAIANTENIASCKVLEKAGLRFINSFDYEEEEHGWYECHAANAAG